MDITPWHEALKNVTPSIFKIKTPHGHGTGFQMIYSAKTGICGIATAYHVIDHAYEWEEPIKVIHMESDNHLLLKPGEGRVIFVYPKSDLAFILFNKNELPLKDLTPDLIEKNSHMKQGAEIGWCGFPAVSPENLCFFNGHVSCAVKLEGNNYYYLVDGVAINGVSGGPAFYRLQQNGSSTVKVCGVISAYRYIEGTPGLSVVRSVEPYQKMLEGLKDLDEAGEKAEEEQSKQNIEAVESEKEKVSPPEESKQRKKSPRKRGSHKGS